LSVPLHHAINPVNELRVIDSCPKEIHLRGHWQGAHHANPAPFGGGGAQCENFYLSGKRRPVGG